MEAKPVVLDYPPVPFLVKIWDNPANADQVLHLDDGEAHLGASQMRHLEPLVGVGAARWGASVK